MRIKFRVWYKSKMWLPEVLQSYSDFMVSAFGGVFFMNEPGYHNGKDHSAILMQFTGLLDKNGKEIYEGDMVRVTNSLNQIQKQSIVSEIGFQYGSFCAYWRKTELWEGYNDNVSPSHFVFLTSLQIPQIEVIGNIYENPELLK